MWLGNGWIDKRCRVQMAICLDYPEERDRYYKVIDNLLVLSLRRDIERGIGS